MRVFINDREVGSFPPSDATIGEIIEVLRAHVDPSEVVTAIELDGRVFNAGDETQYARRPSREVERFAIATRTPRALAAEIHGEVRVALTIVAGKVERVIALFRQGDDRGANRLLAELMEELRLALLLDRQVASIDASLGGLPCDEVGAIATALLDAQQHRAWGELGSLLEARLLPALRGWSAGTASSF
ncbi:MAG TPA: hypothetical protein VEI94_06215 [Candidatus Bathyarchaeia archaeon]|nr:hypothetical protein [Candidatus Bathyarchaeia archaeon]